MPHSEIAALTQKMPRTVCVGAMVYPYKNLLALLELRWWLTGAHRHRGALTANPDFDFDFCLSTSIPVLTTSTCVVAWPQGDQFLGGGM